MAHMTGMFNGCHTPSGDWLTLKGMAMTPYELDAMESGNEGDPRFNGDAPDTRGWAMDVVVTTGMTPGGGAMAK